MSAAKHTPGPWELNSAGFIYAKPTPAHLAKFPKNRRIQIGHVSSFAEATTEEVVANGQLFAAAPELLAALIRLVYGYDNFDNLASAIRDARAALAKAGVQS